VSLCVYVQSSHVLGIKCSTLHVEGKPVMVTMDYKMDVESLSHEYGRTLMQERLVFQGCWPNIFRVLSVLSAKTKIKSLRAIDSSQ